VDVRDDLGSRGALLWRRFAQRVLALPGGAPFRVPFDAADPANTPRGLRTEDPRVRQALIDAIRELEGLEIPLDAPLGDVQNEVRGGERLPIHGGPGTAGVFNAINVTAGNLKRGGYDDVPHGSSYVQVVAFAGAGCPVRPRTILTYSQSANRESPFHSDQTRMYARKQWVDVPFCEEDVARATRSTVRMDATPAPRRCTSRRRLTIRVPRGARVTVAGRRVRVRGRRAVVDLRGRPAGVVRVRIVQGRSTRVRSFRTCARRGR
jgi:acyl-homoserine lactone acylase PvdQ